MRLIRNSLLLLLMKQLYFMESRLFFNTDQGSQSTSYAFIGNLEEHNIRISRDGKGPAVDNIYIERLWRSLKYEEIYLNEYRSMDDLKTALKKYFYYYNTERYHQSLDMLYRMKSIIKFSKNVFRNRRHEKGESTKYF